MKYCVSKYCVSNYRLYKQHSSACDFYKNLMNDDSDDQNTGILNNDERENTVYFKIVMNKKATNFKN